MNDDIINQLKDIVSDQFGMPADSVVSSLNFRKDCDADNLDFTELAMVTEDAFGIVIDDDDMEGVKTFGDFVKLVTLQSNKEQ